MNQKINRTRQSLGLAMRIIISSVIIAVIIGCIVLFLVGRAFGLFQFGGGGKEQEIVQEDGEKSTVQMIEVVGKDIDAFRNPCIHCIHRGGRCV